MDLTKLSIPQLETHLIRWINEAEEKGNKWAAAKALFESLDDKKKPLVAVLKDRYTGSDAFKEMKALTEDDHKIFLEGLSGARHKYYEAQVAYDMAKLKIDALRTIISARKAEVQNFRG